MDEAGTLPQRKRDASMSRVLREARHLFQQKGYYNTTVQELCDRCLLSKTTFFHYFESKAGLVFMIADEFADTLAVYARESLPSVNDPAERIRLAYQCILDSLNLYNNLGGVLYQLISETPARSDILCRFADILRPLIWEAQRAGVLRADIPADALNEELMGLHFLAFYGADAAHRTDAFNKSFAAWLRLAKA